MPTTAVCDDGNPCTTGYCTAFRRGWRCTHENVVSGVACDDSNECTFGEVCDGAGTCGDGMVVDPSDGNPCTIDSCDSVLGVRHTNAPDGFSCDDGDLCNGAEICVTGVCEEGEPLVIDDGNPCTIDTCDSTSGVAHVPVTDGTSCGDDDVCNGFETCQAGICQSGEVLDCDDGNPCTVDLCHPSVGCQHGPTVCSDGSACTIGLCDPALGCTFQPVSCDDGDACTIDGCDDVEGCRHEAVICGTGEICSMGACVGVPLSESVVARVGGQDLEVLERRLGRGRHPVAACSEGLGVAFREVLTSGSARVGVAALSSVGQGRGLWRAPTSVLEPDPVVAAIPSGGFLVAYHDLFADGDGLGVLLVRLDAFGEQVSSPQVVNQTKLFGQHSPDVVWHDGRLWVAWEDDSAMPTEGGTRLCVRSFSASLVPLTEEQCDTAPGQSRGSSSWAWAPGDPARAWRREAQGTGNVEVVWGTQGWSLPLEELPPDGEVPAVVALDASRLLVVYTDGDGVQKAVVLDNQASSAPVVLNLSAASSRYEPSLATTSDGVFLAWRETASSVGAWLTNLEEVYLQRVVWDGVTLSFEETWSLPHDDIFLEGDQLRPALAAVPIMPSGALWTAWDDRWHSDGGPKHGDVRVSWMPTPIERAELESGEP